MDYSGQIIDAHLHLDPSVDGTAEGAVRELDRQLTEAGIAKAIVLHLESHPWTHRDFAKAIAGYPRMEGFVNIHPDRNDAVSLLDESISSLGLIGLKLHPRLQQFDLESLSTLELVRHAGRKNVPVLVDAFPDGTYLMQGFSPLKYAALAKQSPETKFIWAHMGGHHVMDFLMLAKRLENVYMDMSYSLLYYRGSPVVDSLLFAMQSLRCERILYGSDYPDRSLKQSIDDSLAVLQRGGFTPALLQMLLRDNAVRLFSWNENLQR